MGPNDYGGAGRVDGLDGGWGGSGVCRGSGDCGGFLFDCGLGSGAMVKFNWREWRGWLGESFGMGR